MTVTPKVMEALARANEVRLARAAIKHDVAAGRLTLVELLNRPPACCSKVPVFDVLQWAPHIGPSTAHRLVRGIVSETLPLQALGTRSRSRLAEKIASKTGTKVA